MAKKEEPESFSSLFSDLLRTARDLEEIENYSYKRDKDDKNEALERCREYAGVSRDLREVQSAIQTIYEAQMDPNTDRLLDLTFEFEGRKSSLDPIQAKQQKEIIELLRRRHEPKQ